MKKILKVLATGFMLVLLAPVSALAGVAAGVENGPVPNIAAAPPANIQAILPPPVGATVINFDDLTQPCTFNATTALRTAYAALGVTFSGPAPLDGGAIVDQCGNWGVTGHSAPNFLGLNTTAVMSDGGIPRGPQTMTFSSPQSHVQINAGSIDALVITMNAYDGAGALLATTSVTGAAALQTMVVAADGIMSVDISFTGIYLVLDDLAFENAGPPAPTPAYALQLDTFTDCVNVWFDPADGTTHGNVPIYGPSTVAAGLYAGNTVGLGFRIGADKYMYKFTISTRAVEVYSLDTVGSTKTLLNSDTWTPIPGTACPGIMSNGAGNTAIK